MGVKKRILNTLVVDDDEASLKLIELYLASLGQVVFTQTNPLDAINMPLRKSIDLIISDINMPQMDGFEFVTTFREKSGITDIPVVMLTAQSDIEAVKKAAAINAIEYLVKPLDKELTLEKLKKVIQKINAEEVRIDTSTLIANANIQIHCRIYAIAENYVRVISNLQLPEGSRVSLGGLLGDQLGVEFDHGKVEDCAPAKDGFQIKISFPKISSLDKEQIRAFMRRSQSL